ncbi:hypothetical protein [Corynebacterium sp.]|uniref:hypothetical protein n=1 Tax=Corynebacterium sp. TaxID=1720 RepID=UPI0026DD76FB|nr:hypothetical protein [Corynebacterium sp.]MDO5031418.1 hypothetical protein [Corynebacterium sp.]
MTMQRRPNNPIEQKKQAVRKHSRNAVVSVVGGVILGWALTGFWVWMSLGLIVAVVGGVYNWSRIQKIINENNNQY